MRLWVAGRCSGSLGASSRDCPSTDHVVQTDVLRTIQRILGVRPPGTKRIDRLAITSGPAIRSSCGDSTALGRSLKDLIERAETLRNRSIGLRSPFCHVVRAGDAGMLCSQGSGGGGGKGEKARRPAPPRPDRSRFLLSRSRCPARDLPADGGPDRPGRRHGCTVGAATNRLRKSCYRMKRRSGLPKTVIARRSAGLEENSVATASLAAKLASTRVIPLVHLVRNSGSQ